MEKARVEAGNAEQLHAAGQALLDRAGAITARGGENPGSLAEIGELLREISASGVLNDLLALRPGGKRAAVDVIAEHADGSNLSLYSMQDWASPPSDDVHWHNYWQTVLVIDGSWPDTVWRPVSGVADGTAQGVAIDRHERFGQGELQTLGPDEPHGWLAADVKSTDKATLLMWSGSAQGKPRTAVDPATGRLTDDFGFLNPPPGTSKGSGSSASWVRF